MTIPLNERLFTVDEIRAAFWKTFHQSGELWFNYFGPPSDDERDTTSRWEEYLDYLEHHWKQAPDRRCPYDYETEERTEHSQ